MTAANLPQKKSFITSDMDTCFAKAVEECEAFRLQGYSCAESVLRALLNAFSLKVSDQFYKGVFAFAGGAVNDGRCGALEAGLAVLSLLYSKGRMESSYSLKEYSCMMHDIFKRINGSYLCSEIFYPRYDEYMKDHDSEDGFQCAFVTGLEADYKFLQTYSIDI